MLTYFSLLAIKLHYVSYVQYIYNALLCRTITDTEIDKGMGMLTIAMKLFMQSYPDDVVPDFHMAQHLHEDMRNFDPAPV